MKHFLLLIAIAIFGITACEQHDFDGPEGTRRLHDHHGAGHGESEKEHDAH